MIFVCRLVCSRSCRAATFCVVVVYNNVVARLRRTPGSYVEASMDLGADGLAELSVTSRCRASRRRSSREGCSPSPLSFDEIVVTNFTNGTRETLPIWIFKNLRLPNSRPVRERVAMVVVLLSPDPRLPRASG